MEAGGPHWSSGARPISYKGELRAFRPCRPILRPGRLCSPPPFLRLLRLLSPPVFVARPLGRSLGAELAPFWGLSCPYSTRETTSRGEGVTGRLERARFQDLAALASSPALEEGL